MCPVCNHQLKAFIALNSDQLLCPACGSLPRTRRLWDVLFQRYIKEGIEFLDFSPHRSLYRTWKAHSTIHYYGSDLSGDFLCDYQFDVTDIDAESNRFDLLVCYHVLEHVDDDIQAMKEMHRVLKPGGTALIQTPFKEGEIYENEQITDPKDRLQHFGQEDHVRIYSIRGLADRLESVGFRVTIEQFTAEPGNYLGYHPMETILFCVKQ